MKFISTKLCLHIVTDRHLREHNAFYTECPTKEGSSAI